MNSNRKRVLLTGGAGFIGSHLAEALLHRGVYEVSIVDCLDNFYGAERKRANLAEIGKAGPLEFFETDVCDTSALREVVLRVKPEIIIHLAARAGVRPSIEQPLLYERVNVAGTANLLELGRESGVRRFIFGSSSSVYGATSRVPFSEGDPVMRPISPYAATKLAGELICHTYAHLYRFTVICLRFFTVYGPRQRPDLAIHKFTSLIEAGKQIPIFGDGSMGRDYTYVEDIIAGILASLDYQPDGDLPFDTFNLGNSHPIKLSELIENLEVATGRKAVRDYQPLQPGDVPITWADISKASRLLGYKPTMQLDRGLEQFVSWYRSNAMASSKGRT